MKNVAVAFWKLSKNGNYLWVDNINKISLPLMEPYLEALQWAKKGEGKGT